MGYGGGRGANIQVILTCHDSDLSISTFPELLSWESYKIAIILSFLSGSHESMFVLSKFIFASISFFFLEIVLVLGISFFVCVF